MTLREKQSLFARLVGQLVNFIYGHPGWAITFGDFSRTDQKGHMVGSCHYIRLAADLNLFVNGVWQQVDCPAWEEIGAYWKTFHALCAWGGDFKSVDLNHFSLRHDGRM